MPRQIFIAIIVLAALLRVAGIPYGLPLRLISDEPQFILAAIQMLQLKTIFLASHLEEFKSLLYNPPYISYLYLLPFWILPSIVHAVDMPPFFVVARILSLIAGLLTVFFAARIARRLFPEHAAAPLIAAYLAATSILMITVSSNARHWSFATFIATVGFSALTNSNRPFGGRYIRAAIAAGIGMGVNQVIGALLVLALAWHFVMERGTIRNLVRAKWFYLGTLAFALLAALPLMLYPASLRGVQNEAFGYPFTLTGFLAAPFAFFAPAVQSEPALFLLAAAGLTTAWRTKRRLFWMLMLTFIGYAELFFFGYQYQHRFLAVIMPLVAVAAGGGAAFLFRRVPRPWSWFALALVLATPLLASFRLSYLMARNDTRMQARAWIETNLPQDSRIIVWADLMRLAATPEAIDEYTALDPNATGPDELNERSWPERYPIRFHALNLFAVGTKLFYSDLASYVCRNDYGFLVAQTTDFQTPGRANVVAGLAKDGRILASFGGPDSDSSMRFSISGTRFEGLPFTIFRLPAFGPPVRIYELNRARLCP